MNKKLIALAVAAAIAPAAAMADSGNVTIYGLANMSIDQISATGDGAVTPAASNAPSRGRVSSNNSRLGFKGSEDLGNGLSAIWQMEYMVGMDTTGAPGTTRNTFLGVSSKTAGTALMGVYDSPYKLASSKLDIFADTLGDYNSIIGHVGANGAATVGAAFDARLTNSVHYTSPSMSGFQAAIAYGFGEDTSQDPIAAGAANTASKIWSLALTYDQGPFFASLAWERHNNKGDIINAPATDTDESKGTKLSGGYDFNQGTKISAVWEKLTASSTGVGGTYAPNAAATIGSSSRTAYNLNLSHAMGANTFKIAYAKANDGTCSAVGGGVCNTAGMGAKQWTLGVDHAMSKRTNVYALYTKIDNSYDSAAAQGAAYNLGVNGLAFTGTGNDPKALSLGMKHSF